MVKTEAELWREDGRWLVSLKLPAWLADDLRRELEQHALVDYRTFPLEGEEAGLWFIQMQVDEGAVTCPNCGQTVTFPQVKSAPPTWWERLWKNWS